MRSNWKQKLLDHLVRLLAKMALKRRRCISRRGTKYRCALQRKEGRKREVNNSNFICHPTCLTVPFVLIVPRNSSRKVGQASLVIERFENKFRDRFERVLPMNFDSFDQTNYKVIYSVRNTKKFRSIVLQGSRTRSNRQPFSKARLRASWFTSQFISII